MLVKNNCTTLQRDQARIRTLVGRSLRRTRHLRCGSHLGTFDEGPRVCMSPTLGTCLFTPISDQGVGDCALRAARKGAACLFGSDVPRRGTQGLLGRCLLTSVRPIEIRRIGQLFRRRLRGGRIDKATNIFCSSGSTHAHAQTNVLPASSTCGAPIYSLSLARDLRLRK